MPLKSYQCNGFQSVLKARVRNFGETSNGKIDFESIQKK